MKCYLNIVNPIKEEPNMFVKLLISKFGDFDDSEFEKFRKRYWNDYNDEDIIEMFVKKKFNCDVDFAQLVMDAGYDGRILGDGEVVCYYPNQIKSIDNKNPTSSNSINEDVEIKGDEFSFTLDDICHKYPDLVSSSYESCGSAFIMPNGKYLLSGKRFDMHADFAFQCLMDIEELSEQEIENEFDTSNLTNFFTRFFKLIRVNDGSKGDIEDRAYFVIPYRSITSSQMDALQDFVDYILKNKYSKKIYDIQAFVGTNYVHQKWDLQFNNPTSDEIIGDVKFAMTRGFFGESLNESKQDIEKFRQWAGEELANRFFAVKDRLPVEEKDIYYWMKWEKDAFKRMIQHDRWKDNQEQAREYAHRTVIEALTNAIEYFERTPTRREIDTKGKEGAEKVYEDSRWLVMKINTYEASVKYGKHTQWCITGTNSQSDGGRADWENHTEDGEQFYFYIDKQKDHKYALEFKDMHNWAFYVDDDYVDVGEGQLFNNAIVALGDYWNPAEHASYPAIPHVDGLPDIQQAYRDAIEDHNKEFPEDNLNVNDFKVESLKEDIKDNQIAYKFDRELRPNEILLYHQTSEDKLKKILKDGFISHDVWSQENIDKWQYGGYAIGFAIDRDRVHKANETDRIVYVDVPKEDFVCILDSRGRTSTGKEAFKKQFLESLDTSLNDEYDSIVKTELDALNKWLDEYGFEAKLITNEEELDYVDWSSQYGSEAVGMFLQDLQDNASVFPIALNKKVISKLCKDKYDLIRGIKGTLWHEAGHGIYRYLEDIIDMPEDEEDCVEKFARYRENSELFDILQDYMRQDESLNEDVQKVTDKDILQDLDDTFGQEGVYMWSTYILPNGHFLNPENSHTSDNFNYAYEHSDFLDYLWDKYKLWDNFLEKYCMKMNVTYPYIIIPNERITPEQINALKTIIARKDLFEPVIEDCIERFEYSTGKEFKGDIKEPLLIESTSDAKLYDLSVVDVNDIIRDIVQYYRVGSFLVEEKKSC